MKTPARFSRVGCSANGALFLGAWLLAGHTVLAAPTVANVRASQRPGTQLVDVYYDLADAESSALTVSVAVSTNGGAGYFTPGASVSGALGSGIAPGSNKKLTWNAGVDLPARLFSNVRVSVTADDAAAPSGMVLIPAGSFTMGNCMDPSEGWSDELPLHSVYVSAFYMDQCDVTYALWQQVYNWATNHGYSFDSVGGGDAANYPVETVNWFDCVKWCNARSEKEGRTPAYYASAAQTTVYRSGRVDVQNDWVKWNAGYRLPTEAEWEKAARGGASGQRFPWGNTISWSQANYYGYPLALASSGYAYDLASAIGYDPAFNDGVYPYTSPVGYFAPNGYGLYDMAGNAWQWCWDRYASYSSDSQTDPRGPSGVLSYRVLRGGSWINDAYFARCAHRAYNTPSVASSSLGFRCVRGL